MKIERMIEGEIVKTTVIKSKIHDRFDKTATIFIRRLKKLFEQRQDFVESGIEKKNVWFFITNTQDHCIKVYPEGLIF